MDDVVEVGLGAAALGDPVLRHVDAVGTGAEGHPLATPEFDDGSSGAGWCVEVVECHAGAP